MHESGAGRGVAKPLETLEDLAVVAGRERSHDEGKGPYGVEACMRAANAFRRSSFDEVRIIGALRETASALVGGIAAIAGAEIRKTEQAGRAGIVHHQRVSVAVDLIRPYPAKDWMLNHSVLCEGGLQRDEDFVAGGGKAGVGEEIDSHFAELDQGLNGKVIGGYEERVDARVVGRTEHGEDHADGTGRIAVPVEGKGVSRHLGFAF